MFDALNDKLNPATKVEDLEPVNRILVEDKHNLQWDTNAERNKRAQSGNPTIFLDIVVKQLKKRLCRKVGISGRLNLKLPKISTPRAYEKSHLLIKCKLSPALCNQMQPAYEHAGH